MWGNPGQWQQPQQQGGWPIQQAAYQNMPHDQVDWAQLAKQWIAQKEATDDVPQALPANNGDHLSRGNDGSNFKQENTENVSQHGSGNHWNYWNQPPPPPPPDEQKGHLHAKKEEPVHSFHSTGNQYNQEPPAQQFDYNHGNFGYQQPFSERPSYPASNNYWDQDSPKYHRAHQRDFRGRRDPDQSMAQEVIPSEEERNAQLDSIKRRSLPVWIREGLEKMENEKQKKLELEMRGKEKEERRKRDLQAEKDALDEIEKERAQGIVRKSRFDSDSDEENDDADESSPRRERVHAQIPPVERSPSPVEQPKTEEELMEERILKTKRWLTEILLEVTNDEVEVVANEVYVKERKRSGSKAKQHTKSNALASLGNRLGIAYGTDSESEEEDKEPNSDDELHKSIRDKKAAFLMKMKENEERERRDRVESEKFDRVLGKTMHDDPGYHFEKKHEGGIPGLDDDDDQDSERKRPRSSKKSKKKRVSPSSESEDSESDSSNSETDSRRKNKRKSKKEKSSSKKNYKDDSRVESHRSRSQERHKRKSKDSERSKHSRRSKSREHAGEHERDRREHDESSDYERSREKVKYNKQESRHSRSEREYDDDLDSSYSKHKSKKKRRSYSSSPEDSPRKKSSRSSKSPSTSHRRKEKRHKRSRSRERQKYEDNSDDYAERSYSKKSRKHRNR